MSSPLLNREICGNMQLGAAAGNSSQDVMSGLHGCEKYTAGSNMQDVKKVGAEGYRIFSRPPKLSTQKKATSKAMNLCKSTC